MLLTGGCVVATGVLAMKLKQARRDLRRERERANRLEASRREFLAEVSHNLGTPLAAVLGWTDMLESGMARDEAERGSLLRRIRRDLQYVTRSVRQLLDLSRWDSGSRELRVEAFPVAETLMEATETLEEAASEHGTRLSFEGLDYGLQVRADRARVREIFQILLENAVKHAGRGASVVVHLRKAESRLEVSVEDDGDGISGAALARLEAQDETVAGGVGLAIARRLVEAHGGTLSAARRESGGTRAGFTLPLA